MARPLKPSKPWRSRPGLALKTEICPLNLVPSKQYWARMPVPPLRQQPKDFGCSKPPGETSSPSEAQPSCRAGERREDNRPARARRRFPLGASRSSPWQRQWMRPLPRDRCRANGPPSPPRRVVLPIPSESVVLPPIRRFGVGFRCEGISAFFSPDVTCVRNAMPFR
jgi:hypothetical protein